MIQNVGQKTRSQAYYDSLAKDINDGMLYYNPRTQKTTFSNKHCTAVINGSVPHGTQITDGKLNLSWFDYVPHSMLKMQKVTKFPEFPTKFPSIRASYLFTYPTEKSIAQENFLKRIVSFVYVQEEKILSNISKNVNKYTDKLPKLESYADCAKIFPKKGVRV